MQVSSLDAVPLLGNENDVSRPATAARDAFSLLLQNSFEPATNPGLLRLADASGLVRRLSAGREPIADARPVDDTVVREDDTVVREDDTVVEEPVNFNDEDTDPAPNEEAMDAPNEKVADPFEQPEMQLFLSDTRIAPDTPISPTGAPAAIAAVSGQARTAANPALPAAATDGQARAAAAPTLPAAAAVDGQTRAAAAPTLPPAAADGQARAAAARTDGQTRAPTAPILPTAAADGLARAASQRPTAPQQAAVETVAPTIPLNEASAKSGNAGSPGKGAANGGIPATVTKPDPQLVSRPANTLAAAASLAAQTGKAGGPTDATAGNSAPVISDTTANLLLSDSGNKTMNRGNGQRGASQGAATTTGNTPDVTTNITAPSASFTASLAANQTPLPSTAVKPIPGVNQPTNTVSLESNALGGQTPAAASAARPGAAPPPPRPAAPPNALREQIAVQVQKAIAQGVDRISIQLKPAELGRLEIKLDIGQDGKVSALVTIERPDTLELLQKDSRGLLQALQDAGLKTDANGLSFNLRGGDTAPHEQSADGGGAADQSGAKAAASGEVAENQEESARRRAQNSLIDVEV